MDLSGKFKERFLRLETDGIDYDCEFIVGNQNDVVEGHKFLFSAASEVFRAMFYGDLKEDDVVQIEDLDPDGFLAMKEFIYTGCADFTSTIHALKTYNAARKYMIPALSNECVKFIKEKEIKPSEVLQFHEYCENNSITQFKELCCRVIQRKTDEVIESDFFPTCKIETVELILKSPNLKLKSEIEVFNIFKNWAMAQAEREEIEYMELRFPDLKKHIRFLTISFDDFVSCVEDSSLLTQEEKHAIALNLTSINSKTLPEDISGEQEHRNFLHDYYEQKRTFVIEINDSSFSKNYYSLYYRCDTRHYLKMTCKKIDEDVCFELEPTLIRDQEFIRFKKMITFEAKYEVSTVEKRENELLKNKVSFKVDYSVTEQESIIIAKIPISELKDGGFISSDDIVIIEVSFNIIYEWA